MSVITDALVHSYGPEAARKAKARARALSELGDAEAAEMWRQIAERLGRTL